MLRFYPQWCYNKFHLWYCTWCVIYVVIYLCFYREYHHYTTNHCLCMYASGEPEIIHTNRLLNLQTSSLTSFYFGIINQVPSMIYPLSIHPLYSILRLFPSLGRTSVFMSNMALNHRSIRAWSYSVLETKTFINSGFGPNRHFSPLAHTWQSYPDFLSYFHTHWPWDYYGKPGPK